MSKTVEKFFLLMIFSNAGCIRERISEYVADAPRVNNKPNTYFPRENPLAPFESSRTPRSDDENVRMITELRISGVIF
jgi:hypothetical protein